MGQRLDRPSTAATSVPANVGPGAVTSSLSTTFSSLSASSTSSTSSNTSAVNNSNTQGNATSSNSTNAPPNSNSHHRHHRHRHRNHISRGSVPETSLVGASSTPNSSSTTTAAAVAAASDMSPRTRFRTEMARRGYTNSSSDLFFRLFQFPNQQSTATTTSARGESTLTNSSSSQAANTPNIEPLSATPVTSNVVTASRATTGNSSGLSAFRFFNLGGGGGGSSSGQAGDLDSDLSSDEDEPHWNHNLNSLTQSLPFFFGVRDFKCFVCSKQIPADDVEAHIMMCLTKPRLTYNDDVLTGNKGECIICFEELEKGQTIARLPCLCIYHKHTVSRYCYIIYSEYFVIIMSNEELVASWNITLPDGKYKIDFEHGTTSGRRVIRVNGKEIFRENWMFKLVGRQNFTIGKHKCEILIDSATGFTYEYTLEVNGKSYQKFCENQSKILQSWVFTIGENPYRIALEKNTMDLWVNGKVMDVEFIENGTETAFDIDDKSHIRLITVSSGHRRSGLIHCLFLNNKEIPSVET